MTQQAMLSLLLSRTVQTSPPRRCGRQSMLRAGKQWHQRHASILSTEYTHTEARPRAWRLQRSPRLTRTPAPPGRTRGSAPGPGARTRAGPGPAACPPAPASRRPPGAPLSAARAAAQARQPSAAVQATPGTAKSSRASEGPARRHWADPSAARLCTRCSTIAKTLTLS